VRIDVDGTRRPAGAAVAAALAAAGHEVGEGARPDVVVDAVTAPELPGDATDLAAGAELLERASRAGARVILLSSVLVYGDGGDEEIEAAEPSVAEGPLLDAELAVFASAARFLVLRAGLLLGPGTAAAACLGEPDPGGLRAWLPLLSPEDLATWAVTAVAHDLHGVYDAVSDVVRCGELGARPPLGDASRRVTGTQLAGVAGAPRATWRSMRAQALSAS
jgi:hypothetical protein